MRIFLAILAAAIAAEPLFAARAKEPVVITNCRAFAARSDSLSRTAIAGRFCDSVQSDCDDVNKVGFNQVVSVSGLGRSGGAIFEMRAFYPDGASYPYWLKVVQPRETGAPCELWASSSPDFGRGTYAVAVSDADKAGFYSVFAEAACAPGVVPEILYSLGFADIPDGALRARDAELLKVLEAVLGGSEGYTSEFAASAEWSDPQKRASALAELRDYIIENARYSGIDGSMAPGPREFADSLRRASDACMARASAAGRAGLCSVYALDNASFEKAASLGVGRRPAPCAAPCASDAPAPARRVHHVRSSVLKNRPLHLAPR